MAYRLKLDQSPQKNVRRILLAQIDAAEQRLAGEGDRVEAIHESRKSFKRIRALLRLVRSGIGEPTFARENAAYRDIAQLLSASRDHHVLLQTIAVLEKSNGKALAGAASAMREKLEAEAGTESEGAGKLAEARQSLAEARKRIRRIRLPGEGFEVFEDGLARTYKRGRKQMAEALAGGHDETFHEWRKAAQQHWRQMKLVSMAWPAYFDLRAAVARDISQWLGEDHDLSILTAFANDTKRSGLSSDDAGAVEKACRAMQQKLRAEAAEHGRLLFAGKAKDFARHVAGIWGAAQANPPSR